MIKQSAWSWAGSSLDPKFKRPRVGLKRKRERSQSSSSSTQSRSGERSDQEDLFPEEAQTKHVGRKCPGLLAKHAIKEAKKRLLTQVGDEVGSQDPNPVFVKCYRQVFAHSGASAPMRREYLTLATILDSILEGNILKSLDVGVQRLKEGADQSRGRTSACQQIGAHTPRNFISGISRGEDSRFMERKRGEVAMGERMGQESGRRSSLKGGERREGSQGEGSKGEVQFKGEALEGASSSSERSGSCQRLVVNVESSSDCSASSPPASRERGIPTFQMACDLTGHVSQLGALLGQWLDANSHLRAGCESSYPSKHPSTPAVSRLRSIPGSRPPSEP